MATHDYVIDNQSASAFRADLNSVLQAILTQNSSATAPTTATANMIWYDTAANQLKKRNEAGSAWIVLGTIDEALGTFTPSGGGAIASQAQAEAGTNNTDLMTPLRTAQAIAALSGLQNISIQTSGTSFTVPAGVTTLYVLAAGGGGGGGQNISGGRGGGTLSGGNGGFGGFVASKHTVTPGNTITYAVGAGGAGSNTTSGAAGGTTTVSTLALTATGGAGAVGVASGANGTGSGGTLLNGDVSRTALFLGLSPLGGPIIDEAATISTQVTTRPGGSALTAAIAYTSGGTNLFGAGGTGETAGGVGASGGVGGAVIFMY